MKINYTNEILSLVSKMSSNHFLMPDGWSEIKQLSNREEGYKTYVGDRNRPYIAIAIYIGNDNQYEIKITGDRLGIESYNYSNIPKLSDMYNLIIEIYEEAFSFNNESHTEAKRKIREQISGQKLIINRAEKEITRLREMLNDIDLL